MDFGSNEIYIFFPFSLFVSVYLYASVCDFVCISLLLPFVLGLCLSVFWGFILFLKKKFHNNYFLFFILITLFYFILFYFILFYFILSSSLFLSIFAPFYSELCGWQALGVPARRQGCATEVGEPSSGHRSTRDLPAPHDIKWRKSPRDLHLNAKTSSTQ